MILNMYGIPIADSGDFNDYRPEFSSGNIFIRPNFLPTKGMECGGHKHNFDHTTFVVTGSVVVSRTLPDGTILPDKIFKFGEWFLVKAEVRHRIVALENMTAFACIYSHRDAQGNVVQEFTGWEDAYS